MVETPYNTNPELMAMKEDIANRKFRVKLIGMAVTAGLVIAGVATMFFVPGAMGALGTLGSTGAAKLLVGGGMALAGGITSLITMKEVKKLEIDEQYLSSYMQGKNYWGEGYREEVAEHGYSLSSPLQGVAPPSHARKGMLQRS